MKNKCEKCGEELKDDLYVNSGMYGKLCNNCYGKVIKKKTIWRKK